MFLNKAKWIWFQNSIINDYVEFKRDIQLDNMPKHAEIELACDTDYALFINGQFVLCGQYQMVLPKRSYDCIDIKKYINKGNNVINILVHYKGVSDFSYEAGEAGLIYCINIDDLQFVSDSQTMCRRDLRYQIGNMSKITIQMGFNYIYNGNNILDYWQPSTEYHCSNLFFPRPVKKLCHMPLKQGKLIAQGVFKLSEINGTIAEKMQTAYLSAREKDYVISESGALKYANTYLIYDIYEETAGLIYIDIDVIKGTTVDIAYGEHLDDMRVRASVGGRNFANRLICSGGRESFTYYFTRCAGRYIQLHINNADAVVHAVGIIPTQYCVVEKDMKPLKNALHQKIYDVSIRTLKLCMHEHYEDTPWREQAMYGMDSRNQALFGYYCFEKDNFPIKSFQLLADTLQKNGFLLLTAPTEYPITIPVFSFMWIVAIYEYLLHGGNADEVKILLPTIESMLNCYISQIKDGLVKIKGNNLLWHFYEWAEGLDGIKNSIIEVDISQERYDAPYQLFLALALQAGTKIFEFFGQSSVKYSEALGEMKQAFHKTFYNAEKGVYCSYVKNGVQSHYCELTNSLAVYSGICSDGGKIRKILSDDNNFLIKISLSHSVFKVDALMMEEQYFECVTHYIERHFGNMLYNGATSFWETINGADDFDNGGSLCHGWAAMPAYFFRKYANKIT